MKQWQAATNSDEHYAFAIALWRVRCWWRRSPVGGRV